MNDRTESSVDIPPLPARAASVIAQYSIANDHSVLVGSAACLTGWKLTSLSITDALLTSVESGCGAILVDKRDLLLPIGQIFQCGRYHFTAVL